MSGDKSSKNSQMLIAKGERGKKKYVYREDKNFNHEMSIILVKSMVTHTI